MTTVSEMMCAAVRRDLAALEAADPVDGPAPPRRGRRDGASVVLSVRFEPEVMASLERRAALTGLAPSVLARNLVKVGLSRSGALTAVLVDELESVTARLRAAVP